MRRNGDLLRKFNVAAPIEFFLSKEAVHLLEQVRLKETSEYFSLKRNSLNRFLGEKFNHAYKITTKVA